MENISLDFIQSVLVRLHGTNSSWKQVQAWLVRWKKVATVTQDTIFNFARVILSWTPHLFLFWDDTAIPSEEAPSDEPELAACVWEQTSWAGFRLKPLMELVYVTPLLSNAFIVCPVVHTKHKRRIFGPTLSLMLAKRKHSEPKVVQSGGEVVGFRGRVEGGLLSIVAFLWSGPTSTMAHGLCMCLHNIHECGAALL